MIEGAHRLPYQFIKNLQQAIRKPNGRKPTVKDLLVLAQQNDPFYAGNGVEGDKARWFAELWERFGYGSGVHLRRIHYRIVSEGSILKPDGKIYENNSKDWEYMQGASRQARYMGLVDPEEVVDRRNPKPNIYVGPGAFGWEERAEPGWDYDFYGFELPGLEVPQATLDLPDLYPTGYDYHDALQRYHVEVWAEKTTMNDILVPLCRQMATNYVSGAGYQSITAMVRLLRQRVAQLEKPCRVLYVSDYDAAGKNMPRQMARQMQFWIDRYAADYDIRVEPIVMTAEQAAKYPAAPDTGAVELDAMEALEPGKLARIVRRSIAPFRDRELRRRVTDAEQEAAEVLDEEFDAVCEDELSELRAIGAEATQVYERHRETLERVAEDIDRELEPLRERLREVERSITDKLLYDLEPDLPDLPEAVQAPDGEDEGWLFDAGRDYLEQLAYFKRSQEEGRAGDKPAAS
jgi:hypothetical protein